MFAKLAFRGIATVLTLLFAITACVSAQVVDIGPNLIKNPSFEAVGKKVAGTGAVLPQGWVMDSHVFRRDDGVAHSGGASLRYENGDKDRYVFCKQTCELVPGRKYRYSVWIKTKDMKGAKASDGGTVCIEWSDTDGRWMGGSYAKAVPGTSDWTRISRVIRVPEGATSPRLQLYARKNSTGTAWFDDVELVRVADPPLSTIVASPVYRGWITVDEQKNIVPREAVIRARAALADYDISPEQVELRAVLRKVNDAGELEEKVLQEVNGKPGELKIGSKILPDAADLKFSTAGLLEGTYDVETRLIGPEGKCLATKHDKLVRMGDDLKPHSRIDEHNRLLIDEQPFFPLGMYWSGINEKDLQKYSRSKFNCLMPYGSPNSRQMDMAQKHGLKVIYSVKDWYFGSKGCPGRIKSIADEEPAIRKRVREMRDHPALLAWYLNDELSESFMPQLEAHQRIVSEEDPGHPTWAVLYQISQVGKHARTCDVIGSDPYPIGRPLPKTAMPVVASQWTAETSRQMRYARPMWQVPQIFNWANYRKDEQWKKHARTPSFEEMRSMAWQCIAEGATGLIFYSWFDIKRNPDVPFDTQWERLQRIAAEIDGLTPILLSVDPAPAAESIVPKRPEGLHVLSKSHGGKLYIFAVNDGTAETTVEFKVKTSKAVTVLGGEANDRADGERFLG